jgi:uncharacterized membrane protein
MNGFLQDSNGNKSSKRLAGFICLTGLFIVMGITAFKGGNIAEFAWPLVSLIGILFGAGVVEKKGA